MPFGQSCSFAPATEMFGGDSFNGGRERSRGDSGNAALPDARLTAIEEKLDRLAVEQSKRLESMQHQISLLVSNFSKQALNGVDMPNTRQRVGGRGSLMVAAAGGHKASIVGNNVPGGAPTLLQMDDELDADDEVAPEAERLLRKIVGENASGNNPYSFRKAVHGSGHLAPPPMRRMNTVAQLSSKSALSRNSKGRHSTVHHRHHAWLQHVPKIRALSPTHPFILTWDAIFTIALCFVAVLTPLQLAFWDSLFASAHSAWIGLNIFLDVAFFIDLFVRSRMGFWQDGLCACALPPHGHALHARALISCLGWQSWPLTYRSSPHLTPPHALPVAIHQPYSPGCARADVGDSRAAAIRYARHGLPLHLLSAFPYTWPLGPSAQASLAARLLRMVRGLRVCEELMSRGARAASGPSRQGAHAFHAFLGLLHFNPGLARVVQLLVLLLCTCHWLGCAWWLVGQLEHDRRSSGAVVSASMDGPFGPSAWLRNQSVGVQISHELLWGASMVTGFVPFDVIPSTLPEVVLTIIALFAGLAINAILISSTTSALQSIDTRQQIGRQQLEVRLSEFQSLPVSSVPA